MDELFGLITRELSEWLSRKLPASGGDWWHQRVLERLSFQQQRTAAERGQTSLGQLDLAALLRVLDANWFELKDEFMAEREVRTWLKELQSIRNRWAHRSSEEIAPSEVYRDADTLGRFLTALNGDSPGLQTVERVRTQALNAMAPVQVPAAPRGPASLFSAGELVALKARPEVLVPVLRVIQGANERRYEVFQDNAVVSYYESQLQAANRVDSIRETLDIPELRGRLTTLKLLSPSVTNLLSLGSGRVNFVPHQYRPVMKLIRADRPRLLIADEVGVGKTIEAALILKELQARMDVRSVLVVCPKPLVSERKWVSELKRFDEQFIALDSQSLKHCLRESDLEGEWPEAYSKAILPFSLFDSDMVYGPSVPGRTRNPGHGLLTLDPPPRFDVVIVDEAHHLRNPDTYLHQGVRFLCDHAQAVILLTATPVQLGSEDLFTLLNIIRPDLVVDKVSFAQMAEPNRFINEALRNIRAAEPGWAEQALAQLDEVAATEWGRSFLRESPEFQLVYDGLSSDEPVDGARRVKLISTLEGLYTFNAMINRTRRRDIGEFTLRKPETLEIPFTEQQAQFHDDLLDIVERLLSQVHGDQNVRFMTTTIRRQAASCLYGLVPLLTDMLTGKLEQLEGLDFIDDGFTSAAVFTDAVRHDVQDLLSRAEELDPHDPKADMLMKVLWQKTSLPNNKTLLFSSFRHTLRYLLSMAQAEGFRVAVVHGDVAEEERRELRRRFALPKEDEQAIDTLLSSEIGCEGLDFQFCDTLVNYDLPWNPMRVEQRIGRIDRYGQTSDAVTIINLITPGTVDSEIYHRCLLRIGVFHQAVGGNEEILGTITREIRQIAESAKLTDEEKARQLQQLADNSIRRLEEERALENRQAELFGLNIPRQEWREELAAAQSFWLSPEALQNAVNLYLSSRLGRENDALAGEKPLKNLRLAQEARNALLEDYLKLPRSTDPAARSWEKWLKGNQANLAVTFDQPTAVEQAAAVYLTATHPLVRQAARFLEIKEAQNVSVQVNDAGLPSGTYPFALYRWVKQGVRVDDELVPVATDSRVERALMDTLAAAARSDDPLPDERQREVLDTRHHALWSAAHAEHGEYTRQMVDFRLQSLTVSHRARVHAIREQVERATNDKIRLMKESELARAEADFERRTAALEQTARSGDILTTPVLFGTLKVLSGGQQ